MNRKTCSMKSILGMIFMLAVLSSAGNLHADETGLVLSGGGGKGAYEVGVWMALNEYGIAQEVSIISGTSVGGLNAALFALMDVSEIEEIWKNDVPSYLTLDEDGKEVLISQSGIMKIMDKMSMEKLREGYPLVVVNALRNNGKLFSAIGGILHIVKPGARTCRFRLDKDELPEIKQKLLATSAFPFITDPVLLNDGFYYVDGGWELAGGDNTPIDGIFDVGYEHTGQIKDIYVVYLEKEPKRRIKVTDYDKYNIIEIIPSIDLSDILDGTCNFTMDRIKLLIDNGYNDTVRLLKEQGRYPVSGFWFR